MTTGAAVHVRGYLIVFGALLALTIVTVGVSLFEWASTPAIAVGLAIASVKASLVALFFMHLKQERGMVPATLVLTAVICAGLIGFTLLTEADHAPGTRFVPAFDVSEESR